MNFKRVTLVFFLLGLIYIILPSPTSIDDFPPLPGSIKSDLNGDTIQNPNISAYFHSYNRGYVTNFYRNVLKQKDRLGLFFPPLRLNHPPEEAYTYVRDQQESTFLEEYTYPFKESLFINGFEPVVKNGRVIDLVADNIPFKGQYYPAKTTLRFYPTTLLFRILIYILSWILLLAIFKLTLKIGRQY